MRIFSKSYKGFTIVELLIVIVVIGILATIGILSYGAWRTSVSQSEVKSELQTLASAMESDRNFGTVYSSTTPSGYTKTANVNNPTIVTSSSGDFYCATIQSTSNPSIQFRITSIKTTPVAGDCVDYQGLTVASGLAAWWPFKGNANDYSGQGNNGTVHNATLTTGQNGQSNSAYSFDGTTSYIDTVMSTSLGNITKGYTLSAWVNATDVSGSRAIFAPSRQNSQNGVGISINNAQAQTTTYGIKDYINTSPLLVNGTWYHLVATVNSSYSATFYINGVQQQTVTHTVGGNVNNDDIFMIGSSTVTSASTLLAQFQGTIDDVRVYSKVLTAAQILDLYSAGAL